MTSSPENKITRSDLVKSAVNVGALGMEFSWTYYKQMNIAFCLMVANMLKKIYAGRPDDYAEALHRHCAFFNITVQFAPFVGGIAGGSLSIGSGVRIDNCSVTGSAISLTAENWAYAGGILGAQAMNGVITNSWTDVTVSAISKSGLTCVGGITAINSNGAMLANCAALGNVISHNGYTLTSTISGSPGSLSSQPKSASSILFIVHI